jgi:phage gp36-like protein
VPYLDPADVRLILAGTENAAGTAASLTDNDLTDAISEAQDEVDGRLAARYDTPFTDPPTVVVNITRDIAAYLATLTYRRGDPIQPGETIQLRYNRAQNLLSQAANGTFPLPLPGGGGDEAAAANVVNNPTSGDLWTEQDFHLVQRPAQWSGITNDVFPRPGW